jgi:hypothetical protein
MKSFAAGDRVTIKSRRHPWAGHSGVLLEYGPYGLSFMGTRGWRIRLDNRQEVYAKVEEL